MHLGNTFGRAGGGIIYREETLKTLKNIRTMTKMKTVYLGGLRTEAEHLQSGNKLITDAPLDNNGKGETCWQHHLDAACLQSWASQHLHTVTTWTAL